MLDVVLTFLIQIVEMLCLVLMPGMFLLYVGYATVKRRQTLSDETANQFSKPDPKLKTQKKMLEKPTWFNDTPEGRKLLQNVDKHPDGPNVPASKPKPFQPKMSSKATVEKDGENLTPLERAVEQYAPRAITEGTFTFSPRHKKWVGENVKIDGKKISQLLNEEANGTQPEVDIPDMDALKIMEKQAKEETQYMPRSQESSEESETEEE